MARRIIVDLRGVGVVLLLRGRPFGAAVARGTCVFLENLEVFAPVLSSDEDD